MSLTRDNDVVQTLALDRSDQPFGKPILPRWRPCNLFVPNAHDSQWACEHGAIDPIAITGSCNPEHRPKEKPR
jgi:hypothetical protein